jgi:hypothetical protein
LTPTKTRRAGKTTRTKYGPRRNERQKLTGGFYENEKPKHPQNHRGGARPHRGPVPHPLFRPRKGKARAAGCRTPPAPFILSVQLSGVTALAFSEDGAFLASGFAGGSFAFWRIADGERTVFSQSAADLRAAADAAGIALWDETIDAEAGAAVSALNREKTRLASGYADGSIILKDAATGRELARFITSEGGEWISITPKGYFNASARGGEILKPRAGEEIFSMSRLSELFRRPDLYEAAVNGKEVSGPSAAEVAADTEYQPPLVEIPGPKTLSVKADTAELPLRIMERGGGVGRLVVYLNGTPVGTPELGDYQPRASVKENRWL